MTEVLLHVYDVTSSSSATTNNAVLHMNKLLRGGIRLGGIFHSAVEVYDCEEWSFGYSGTGSGVFSCPQKGNPLYSYRETISLGQTSLSRLKVTQVLFELGREWPGTSYNLLSRNCNHFCDAFCERLGVQRLPAWVNRFAHVGVATTDVLEATIRRLRDAKNGVVSAGKLVYQFLARVNPSSAISSNSGVHAHVIPTRNTTAAFGWTFLRTSVRNSRLFAPANCFGLGDENLLERGHVERL